MRDSVFFCTANPYSNHEMGRQLLAHCVTSITSHLSQSESRISCLCCEVCFKGIWTQRLSLTSDCSCALLSLSPVQMLEVYSSSHRQLRIGPFSYHVTRTQGIRDLLRRPDDFILQVGMFRLFRGHDFYCIFRLPWCPA